MEKKRTVNRRILIYAATAILVLIAVSIGIFAMRQSVDTPDHLLSLGEKYHAEFNYEQSLVQFLKVIEIDPMNPRGYIGAAEAYVGLDRIDDAIAVLRQGLEHTNDDRIRGMLARLESEFTEAGTADQNIDRSDGGDLSNVDSSDIIRDAQYTLSDVPYAVNRLNLPYINLNSNDAKQVNEQLYSYFKDVALAGNPNPDEFGSERGPWYTNIDYTYFINGDVLSVVVIRESGGTAPPIYGVMAYNLNIKSGKLLSYDDLAAYAGCDAKTALELFSGYALQKVNDEYKDYDNVIMTQRSIAATYATNKAWYELNQMPWFINKDGRLCAFDYLSIGLLSSGNFFTCYTVDGESISLSIGNIGFEEGLSDAWKPVSDTSVPDSILGTWKYETTPGSNRGRILFDESSQVAFETDGQLEKYKYSYDAVNGLLTIDLPNEETLCYATLIDESTLMLYSDHLDDWMASDVEYPFDFDSEFHYFTLTGFVFDADDYMILTRTEDMSMPTTDSSNPLHSILTNGYWISDGFRLSDTVLYRFERGKKESSAGYVKGTYYWDYHNAGNGSWREGQTYLLGDDVLTLYSGNEITDTLDFDINSGRFISRVNKQLVEQDRMENGIYIPAKTRPYSLSNRSDDPR